MWIALVNAGCNARTATADRKLDSRYLCLAKTPPGTPPQSASFLLGVDFRESRRRRPRSFCPPPDLARRTRTTDSARVGGRSACTCCRCLSPWLMAGRGDHLPCLPAEAGAGVAAFPSRRTACRGAAARLAPAVRPHSRPLAPRRGAGAAGVPHVWPSRTWLREGVVLDLSEELSDPVLLSWSLILPVL